MITNTGTLTVSRKDAPVVLVNLISKQISIGRIDGLEEPIHVTNGRIGLKDSTLDTSHASVVRDEEGQFWIENSSNDEIKVTDPRRVRLKPGDKRLLEHSAKFEIGEFQFTFRAKATQPVPSDESIDTSDPIQVTARSAEAEPENASASVPPIETESVDTATNSDQSPAAKVSSASPASEQENPHASEKASEPGSNDTAKPDPPKASSAAPKQAPSKAAAPTKPPKPKPLPRLPNGIVGTPYDHPIPMKHFEAGKKSIRPEFSQDIGLRVNADENGLKVVGTPTVDGKHELTIEYDAPNLPGRKLAFEIFINPDPRSLWKNLESDPSLPYQKDVSRSERLQVDGAQLLAASVRGRSHAHEGTFRDDDFTLGSNDGWHFIAVSDGAGSAKYSRMGSLIACDTAYREFFARIDELDQVLLRQPSDGIQDTDKPAIGMALYNIFGNAGKNVFENISKEAAEPTEAGVEPAKVNDYAATLIYTAFKKFEFGWFVGAFAIGDGGIAVYHQNDEVHVMNNPDGGEYAGQTRFATMPYIWDSDEEIRKRIQVHVVPSFTAIVAMTDGVSDPKFGTDKNFFDTQEWHGFWNDIGNEVDFDSPDCHEALLSWLDFWSAGNHDDRTIAIGLLGHE